MATTPRLPTLEEPSPAMSTLSSATFTSNGSGATLLSPDASASSLASGMLGSALDVEALTPEQRQAEETKVINMIANGRDGLSCGCDSPEDALSPVGASSPIHEEVNLPAEMGKMSLQSHSNGEKHSENASGFAPVDLHLSPGAPPAKAVAKGSKEAFDRFTVPDRDALDAAAKILVTAEGGDEISFGELIRQRERSIVCFLRHMWCGQCAQYVVALRSASANLTSASTTTLSSSSTNPHSRGFNSIPPFFVILISNGSPSLIPIYRERLNVPFPLYVDRSRKLYKTLGMTLKTLSAGSEKDKGSYITEGLLKSSVKSAAMGITMLRNPGDQRQLGGEFVFTCAPGSSELNCTFASRMNTTRSHSEVRDLFAAAGVHLTPEDELAVYGSESVDGHR